ncbi:MAG: hypothetical protein ACI4XF_12345, partial [Oscillospiraceae bacterium]
GTILNELTTSLSENSSYEVATPKATMAVRGTSFMVSVEQNEDGSYIIKTNTFHGKVEVSLLDSDGVPTGETAMLPEGKGVIIKTVPNSETGNPAEVDGTSFFVYETDEGIYVAVIKPDDPVSDIVYDYIAAAVREYALRSNDDGTMVLSDYIISRLRGYPGTVPASDEETTVTTAAPEPDSETTVTTTVPEPDSETAITTTVPESKHETSVTTTVPESKHETSVTTTVPESKRETSVTTTVPESKRETSITTTVPESKHETSAETTVPDSKHETSVTTTVPKTENKPSVTTTVPQTGNRPSVTTTVPQTGNRPSVTTTVPQTGNTTSATTTVPQTETTASVTTTVPQGEDDPITTTTVTEISEASETTTTAEETIKYNVSFIYNGEVVYEEEVESGQKVSNVPQLNDIEGNTHMWVYKDEEFSPDMAITSDIVIVGKYTPIPYTVKYVLSTDENYVLDEKTVPYGDVPSGANLPTTLDTDNDGILDLYLYNWEQPTDTVKGNTVIPVSYTDYSSVLEIKITDFNGEITHDLTKAGSTITLPTTAAERENYTFIGWGNIYSGGYSDPNVKEGCTYDADETADYYVYSGGTAKYDPGAEVTLTNDLRLNSGDKNYKFVAIYSGETYSVTYKRDGDILYIDTVLYRDKIPAKAFDGSLMPEQDGYTVVWTCNGSEVGPDFEITEDVTLVGTYEPTEPTS